jgi:hypothetical protein
MPVVNTLWEGEFCVRSSGIIEFLTLDFLAFAPYFFDSTFARETTMSLRFNIAIANGVEAAPC